MSMTRDWWHVDKVIAGLATLGAALVLAAPPVGAAEPEIMGAAQMTDLVAHAKGEILVHLTLTVPSCPPCVSSLTQVPPVIVRSGWKGRYVRVQWDDWDAMGRDEASLKIKDGLLYVPIILLFRDGQEVARYTLGDLAKLEHDLKASR